MAEVTERLIKMGRELGYSGADLQMFLKDEKAEIMEREKEERGRGREKKQPFTLMYGRQVRGPADIIADICSGTHNVVEEYFFSSMIMQTDYTRTSPKLVRSRQKTQN